MNEKETVYNVGLNNWAAEELRRVEADTEEEKLLKDQICGLYARTIVDYQSLPPKGQEILRYLLDGYPLTKLEDNDPAEWEETTPAESEENYHMFHSLRYDYLFKEVTGEEVRYFDVRRAKAIDVDHQRIILAPICDAWLDKHQPVEMPYFPSKTPWTFYVEIGQDNMIHIMYLKTPQLTMVKIDKYYSSLTEDAKEIKREAFRRLPEYE